MKSIDFFLHHKFFVHFCLSCHRFHFDHKRLVESLSNYGQMNLQANNHVTIEKLDVSEVVITDSVSCEVTPGNPPMKPAISLENGFSYNHRSTSSVMPALEANRKETNTKRSDVQSGVLLPESIYVNRHPVLSSRVPPGLPSTKDLERQLENAMYAKKTLTEAVMLKSM